MRIAKVILGTVLLIAAIVMLVVNRGSSLQALGPVDGHDLPREDLERVALGTIAPDFLLSSLSGEVETLSDARGEKDVLLVFYRGHW